MTNAEVEALLNKVAMVTGAAYPHRLEEELKRARANEAQLVEAHAALKRALKAAHFNAGQNRLCDDCALTHEYAARAITEDNARAITTECF